MEGVKIGQETVRWRTMRNLKLPEVGQYIRKRILKQRWYRLMLILSSIVVFCTTYALILPAITLEKQCNLPEHIHDQSCYAQAEIVESHVHTDSCYTREQGTLLCDEHEHTKECWAEEETLICGMEEGQEISQTVSEENSIEEQADSVTVHHHTEECFQITEKLVCGIESDHHHNEECYSWENILSCSKEENSVDALQNEPVLICGMEEHIHTEACNLNDEIQPEEAVATDDTDGTIIKNALDIEPYIKTASLYYKAKESTEWTKITGNESNIPGDASFKLEIGFEGTKITELVDAGYQMKYTLPKLFRDAVVSASITSGNENAGTMSVKDGVVTLSFSEEWIKKQQQNGNQDLDGSFYVEAEVDLNEVPDNGKTEIKIGNTTITINFDQDIIAKYATVDLEKKLIELKEETDGDYLYYTLSVTAGKDGCTDVVVKDSFNSGKNYIGSYMVPEEEKENVKIDDAGNMVWTVGSMAAGETKTLTYKVKLTPDYLGVKPKGNISNQAIVYSGEYQRDTDTATFEPKGKATLSKVSANYVADESGGGTIRYTVWVHADETNNYTLDNVTIWDALDGTVTGGYKTEESIWQYLEYQDFHLYEGGSKSQNGADGLTEIEDAEPVQLAKSGKNFQYSVGNLAPGESKTLVYTVKVNQGVYTVSNEDIDIGNRATILTDPTREDGGNQRLENFHTMKTLTSKKWARKIVGEEVADKKTISMNGFVYDMDGKNADTASFDVPKGSYLYQVAVNEAGDWNVVSAVMKDELHSVHMQYIGYLQINAYNITDNKNYGTDQNAVAALAQKTPAQTVWVKIDGENKFEFFPQKFGLENGKYAYLLNYYAVPTNIGAESTVVVANEFNLTGTVIGTGGTYQLTGINVSASVQLQGNNYFSAKKNFWYYEPSSDQEDNGNLYWIIQVQGNRIPSGTEFKDCPWNTEETVYHNCEKIVSAFTANTIESFSDDITLSELKTKYNVTEFTDYTQSVSSNELIWTLTKDVILAENESLYFVVNTKPTKLPEENGKYITYSNSLYTKDPVSGAEWVWQSEDKHSIVAGNNVYKDLAEVFQVKAEETEENKQVVFIKGDEKTVLQNDYLIKSGSGIYVAWKIRINQDSTLSGTYRVEEQIPEGMEIVYVQRYSTGWKYGTLPVFSEIADLSGWNLVKQEFSFKDERPTPAIYYVKGQNVIWDVSGLVADSYQPGGYYVDFLIVCKLTDSEVLLGGETKTFNNQVTLKNQLGKKIGFDTDGVELSAPKLSKTGIYDPNVNGGRYPFKIVLNELGTDLVPGSATIQLIDEMNAVLILDPTSIKVTNQITEEEVDFTSAIEGHTLTLTIPDDQPLIVTYEASINAAPGEKITIENNAHWVGYETIPGGSVKNDNFSYAAGATVGANTYPTITITKVDQYNNQLYLEGAEFRLTEMVLNEDGSLTENANGILLSGTTNAEGKLSFGNDSSNRLKCNTVYSLIETKAPEGYVTDSTPHYFLVAKKETSENGDLEYPDYSKYQGVTIYYSSAQYNYTAYNHKGEITISKKFENAAGGSLEKLNGTYTFGLFEHETDVSPIQQSTIVYKNGTVSLKDGVARFTNVELGKTYWVYELNDEGQPIKDQKDGKISGIPFIVFYENNKVTVTAENAKQEVVITNRMNYAELPNSGGSGTVLYTVSGSLLIFSSVVFLYQKKKRNSRDYFDKM